MGIWKGVVWCGMVCVCVCSKSGREGVIKVLAAATVTVE